MLRGHPLINSVIPGAHWEDGWGTDYVLVVGCSWGNPLTEGITPRSREKDGWGTEYNLY